MCGVCDPPLKAVQVHLLIHIAMTHTDNDTISSDLEPSRLWNQYAYQLWFERLQNLSVARPLILSVTLPVVSMCTDIIAVSTIGILIRWSPRYGYIPPCISGTPCLGLQLVHSPLPSLSTGLPH